MPYEAVGPGAHAFDGVTRRWNAARLDGYVAALGRRAASRPAASDAVDAATPRRRSGSSSACAWTTASPLAAAHAPPLADHFGWALAAELARRDRGDRLVLTTRGRLLSNELFARLLSDAARPSALTLAQRRLLRCRHAC